MEPNSYNLETMSGGQVGKIKLNHLIINLSGG